MGIEHTIKFLDDVSHLAVEAIAISKEGLGWSAYGQVVQILGEMNKLISEAKLALPELEALDSQEALQLGAAAYVAITKIVASV